ncbi:MAG: hypothetical protein RH862_07120 [Leptospiraceae bacterium]
MSHSTERKLRPPKGFSYERICGWRIEKVLEGLGMSLIRIIEIQAGIK